MDAWYEKSLDLELMQLKGINFTAEAIDISKCFDQISRPLLYKRCQEASMPANGLDSYERFQEGLNEALYRGQDRSDD